MNESNASRLQAWPWWNAEDAAPSLPRCRDGLFHEALMVLGLQEPRLAVRHACRYPVSCRPVTLRCSRCFPAALQDISTSGAGLLLSRAIEPGRILAVTLPGLDAVFPHPLCLTTVHCRPVSDTRWLVGGSWTRPISVEQLAAVLAAATSDRELAKPLDFLAKRDQI